MPDLSMLDAAPLDHSLSADAYAAEKGPLRARLAQLQRLSVEEGQTLLVVFEGWDAAGKGSAIHRLTERLDPRGVTVHPIRAARPFERERPWLWRFWLSLPPHGHWAVYDRSWYGRVLVERVDGLAPEPDWRRGFDEIRQFEKMLTDDGTVLVKLFLHISQQEQHRRLTTLAADPALSWKVTTEDWQNHRRYALWHHAYSEALDRTHTDHAPWTVVPATCPRFATRAVYQSLIQAIDARLNAP